MKKYVIILLTCLATGIAHSQSLTLEDCRQLALKNNRNIAISRIKQTQAKDLKEVARAQYLPKVNAVGSYMHTSKDISLLSDDTKSALSNLGTNSLTSASQALPGMVQDMLAGGLITPAQAQGLNALVEKYGPSIAQSLNGVGDKIIDAFETKTRNIWAGSVMVTQPLYMGGRITALNKIADINEQLAANEADNAEQEVLINTEKAYWLAVSLKQKQTLAEKFHELVKKLHQDVSKMVAEGVATKADELSVSVKENEAEMTLIQVNDGLALSKMALCQIVGMPINSNISLADEGNQSFIDTNTADITISSATAYANRPEIKMLENASSIAEQGIKLTRAGYMPSLALTGGYLISNPNTFNGFQRNFKGVWNVGVMLQVPVWDWGATKYKIRAAKSAATMAQLKLTDAKELIQLQLNQNEFKLNEAKKKLSLTSRNISSADENLRAATLGFKEGVMTTSNVLEAQTAWLKAQTQKIDAEIDLRLATAEVRKSLGIIRY